MSNSLDSLKKNSPNKSSTMGNSNTTLDKAVLFLYFSLYIIIALSLLFRQPFGNPPDEFNRYLIPQYIAEHGTLPNGYDESIRIPAYGFSYAFQPILPYMAQGYVMRLVGHFTRDAEIIFYSARLVDFAFGLVMAVFVLLLSRKWFHDRRLRYLFCFLTMFLPQSIFLHTYVNTDSCCMMSIAIMLYGLTCCLQDDFAYRSCTVMSVGIILCALSYYNAYGYILSCILLFTAHFLSLERGRLRLNRRPFLRKGIFISALVLLGIGWWFVRSYVLYDGDFLGLRTRDLCGALYGNEDMKPDVRITYKSLGYTVPSMLLSSDFCVISVNSFICMYGPMIVTTALWIYRFYKLLFSVGILGSLLPLSRFFKRAGKTQVSASAEHSGISFPGRPVLSGFFHANMLLCMAVPCILSLIYSYGTDYQPQGRYLMPILLPLCYYCVRGLQKGYLCLLSVITRINGKRPANKTVKPCLAAIPCLTVESCPTIFDRLFTSLCAAMILLIVIAVCVTVYGYAFPYFAGLSV